MPTLFISSSAGKSMIFKTSRASPVKFMSIAARETGFVKSKNEKVPPAAAFTLKVCPSETVMTMASRENSRLPETSFTGGMPSK